MRRKIFASIIITLLIVSSVGIIVYHQLYIGKHDEKQWWEKEIFHYEVEIIPNGTGNYTVYLPVPLISRDNNPNKGKPITLMNELELIEGNTEFNIINTTYGPALAINSSGRCLIRAHREFENETTENDDNYIFGGLSMALNEKWNSPNKIYYNSSGFIDVKINLNIFNKREHSRGGHSLKWGCENYTLSEGWQEINLLIEYMETG